MNEQESAHLLRACNTIKADIGTASRRKTREHLATLTDVVGSLIREVERLSDEPEDW